ncbi:YqaA family protein [Limoniibacter endophyticus]|uniref:Membrane protein n=1 Tax=Limoniibacter endophyticus TaxID=1565040 RepID=A0A8J3DLY7_9HYPH|nr:YqaA family protein [Limoniibacter endophyticus]GHC61889.1 membrane protein [Limoniibacter endophyticus]
MVSILSAYGGLFLSALIAASLLPMQSEAVLVGLIYGGQLNVFLLVLVATVGNVMGSLINWFMGRRIEAYKNRSWFPATPQNLERAQSWYRRYGRWALLASWMPVIGDPITLVAGVLRESLPVFLVLVTLAKAGRYTIIALAVAGII